MARKDSEHQKKSMSMLFRGKAIFKALNTGHIDEHVSCVRKWRTAAETCVSPELLIEMRGLWQTREKATGGVPIALL